MTYSDEELERLQNAYLAVSEKRQRLSMLYLGRDYNNEMALEYVRHGFLRRLGTLVRCIENTFKILPLDQVDPPSMEDRLDTGINIQAFVFNVFGSVDNLAWIWVREQNITKNDGSPIAPSWVGLRRTNEFVRDTFSEEFSRYLDGL